MYDDVARRGLLCPRARVARAATADGARAAVCVARRAAISTPSTRERCVEIIATRARRAARAARARRAGGWTSRDVAREGKRARGRSGETRGARGRSGRWARARRASGGWISRGVGTRANGANGTRARARGEGSRRIDRLGYMRSRGGADGGRGRAREALGGGRASGMRSGKAY